MATEMWQRRAFLKAAGAGFVATPAAARAAEALERAELVFASSIEISAAAAMARRWSRETGELIARSSCPIAGMT